MTSVSSAVAPIVALGAVHNFVAGSAAEAGQAVGLWYVLWGLARKRPAEDATTPAVRSRVLCSVICSSDMQARVCMVTAAQMDDSGRVTT